MNFCSQCGKELDEDARFCPGCGIEQDEGTENPPASVLDESPTIPQPKSPKKVFGKKPILLFSAGLAAIIGLTVIIIAIASMVDNYSYVRVNDFVKSWNVAATQQSDGLTRGVKIQANDMASSNSFVELGDGTTISFKTSDKNKNIKEVTYLAPNIATDETASELLKILSKNISDTQIAQGVAGYHEASKDLIQEEVTGFSITFSSTNKKNDIRFSVKPVYPYAANLQKGVGSTGLVFDMTVEDFCDAYNKWSEDKLGGGTFKRNASNDEYISSAKSAVCDILKAPTTASWGAATVEEKDEYGRAIVTLTVDAQNGFGAMIREHYVVCIQGVTPEGKYLCDKYIGVRAYDELFMGIGKNEVKKLNGFGEPRNTGYAVQPSGFKSRTNGLYNIYEWESILLFVEPTTNKICSIWFTAKNIPEDDSVAIAMVNLIIGISTNKIPGFKTLEESGPTFMNGVLYEVVKRDSQVFYCATAMRTQAYEQGLRTRDIMDKTASNTYEPSPIQSQNVSPDPAVDNPANTATPAATTMPTAQGTGLSVIQLVEQWNRTSSELYVGDSLDRYSVRSDTAISATISETYSNAGVSFELSWQKDKSAFTLTLRGMENTRVMEENTYVALKAFSQNKTDTSFFTNFIDGWSDGEGGADVKAGTFAGYRYRLVVSPIDSIDEWGNTYTRFDCVMTATKV